MSITKNLLLNWYSLMKKKIEKDSDDFWQRKLTLKVKFFDFDTTPLHQFSKFNSFLSVCWFFDPRTWNSITSITISIYNTKYIVSLSFKYLCTHQPTYYLQILMVHLSYFFRLSILVSLINVESTFIVFEDFAPIPCL